MLSMRRKAVIVLCWLWSCSASASLPRTKLAVVIFPSTKGYQHFQFSDYSTLTILGVIVACVAVTLLAGFTGTWRAMGATAAPHLRNE